MAIDAIYQAMPEGCTLLEKAKSKGFDWIDSLSHYHTYAEEEYLARLKLYQIRGQPKVDDESIEFAEEAIRTEKLYPGLKQRYLFWGRAWDKVHYLLSAKRRGENVQQHDKLIERAILGGDILETPPPDGRSLFQVVKYLPPIEVHKAVEVLEKVTENQMRQNYHPEAMEGVYKYFSESYLLSEVESENAFRDIFSEFEELRHFYALVAEHNEGIITCLT